MLFVYTTMPNLDEAEKIATYIIEERLAACANILPQMLSIYHWQEKIEKGTECVCIFKTQTKNFNALQQAITKLHSYETPCIVALPLSHVAKPFADWIKQESSKATR